MAHQVERVALDGHPFQDLPAALARGVVLARQPVQPAGDGGFVPGVEVYRACRRQMRQPQADLEIGARRRAALGTDHHVVVAAQREQRDIGRLLGGQGGQRLHRRLAEPGGPDQVVVGRCQERRLREAAEAALEEEQRRGRPLHVQRADLAERDVVVTGVDQPDLGALFADMAVPQGRPIEAGRLLQPKVEAEVALVLGADLQHRDPTVADLLRATAFALPALEIVDSRIAGWDITHRRHRRRQRLQRSVRPRRHPCTARPSRPACRTDDADEERRDGLAGDRRRLSGQPAHRRPLARLDPRRPWAIRCVPATSS